MKPVHFMRWAPADYLLDAFVSGCYRRGDYRTLAFYSGFLFRSHLEGGSLPADPQQLADHLGMRQRDVEAALAICVQAQKLTVQGGRVSHKRVAGDLSREMEFRQEQARLGKEGASVRWGSPRVSDRPPHKGTDSQPDPYPLPVPVPKPLPVAVASDEPTFDRDAWLRRGWSAIRQLSALTGQEPEIIAMEGSSYARHDGTVVGGKSDIRGLTQDRLVKTVLDLEASLKAEQAKQANVAAQ